VDGVFTGFPNLCGCAYSVPFGIPLGKHILKMYNSNFVFGKKKKNGLQKILPLKITFWE
jgi:hypothetical protein